MFGACLALPRWIRPLRGSLEPGEISGKWGVSRAVFKGMVFVRYHSHRSMLGVIRCSGARTDAVSWGRSLSNMLPAGG